jgi:GT2 family glycosyltransferase
MSFLRRLGAWLSGRKTHAAWMSDTLVLVAGRPGGARSCELRATVAERDLELRLYACPAQSEPLVSRGERSAPMRASVLPMREFATQCLRPLPDGGRKLMEELIRAVAPELEGPDGLAVAKSLRVVRDATRGELREPTGEHGAALAINVDAILAIDDRAYWAHGWVNDPESLVERLEIVSPEGQRADLLVGGQRYARPDVAELFAAAGGHSQRHGFLRYFELPHPSRLRGGWRVEVRDTAGDDYRVNAPNDMTDNPLETRLTILREVASDRPGKEELRESLGHPALARLQRRLRGMASIEAVDQYGEPPEAPRVTVIVPLYKRVDFVEHQLAQFGRDPDIAAADLIYVLDSPELAPQLAHLGAALSELHGVPFRVARTARNVGYAIANNLAAELARADTLLLLNSDVLPVEPGWLGRLHAFHQATPDIGALGPKLLFEDESIQHAGMYFELQGESGLWANRHYFKGFSRSPMAANVSRPVPAVTGACMMIGRALYEELGGLPEDYIEGGFEDSDFCIRLLEAGRHNWYLADVELFHLEAQSYRTEARVANVYNAWLQTHRWGERIDEIMRAQAAESDAQLMLVDAP